MIVGASADAYAFVLAAATGLSLSGLALPFTSSMELTGDGVLCRECEHEHDVKGVTISGISATTATALSTDTVMGMLDSPAGRSVEPKRGYIGAMYYMYECRVCMYVCGVVRSLRWLALAERQVSYRRVGIG
jgi:hypothetical protein